ncbi:hypothetical protein TVAG_388420 [Trichomonas vaginalis G3]|uniref:Uncharacterized protein n=1 Tax=Trichomonas vaginalis (strain ATCC PRA-98 / G3) TaxID=412133 RepID=A2DYH6_TRIV3|nr:ankyrin repeat, PH and SEC7 domain containing protein SECG-related family [Trichomonas vaginalis G3]EAY14511.1 hypothetical protein TVAG_388420 [Trichomonas vaginalis G3]KAI5529316.1 ankyrin repeat, PH and SEC7 domain containing protein SECG-related family [Trichomonas vaginalis G3]|eukprot:XP_001326734.1 hypothetical protein [Trichomonas vaginalis G3]
MSENSSNSASLAIKIQIEDLIFQVSQDNAAETTENIKKILANTNKDYVQLIIEKCAQMFPSKFILYNQLFNEIFNQSLIPATKTVDPTQLISAILSDDIAVFKSTFEPIDKTDHEKILQIDFEYEKQHFNVMNLAAKLGAFNIFKTFIENKYTFDKNTFIYAIESGNKKLIDYLIGLGCNVTDNIEIFIKFHQNNYIFEELEKIKTKISIELIAYGNNTPALYKLSQMNMIDYSIFNENISQFLSRVGSLDILKNYSEKQYSIADITSAAQFGNIDAVKYLINSFNDKKLVFTAIASGQIEVFKFLHEKGLANEKKFKNQSFCICAAKNKQNEMLSFLLDNGFNAKSQDSKGNNCFLISVANCHKESVDVCINHGLSLESKNSDGETPIIVAVKAGDKDLVEYLLEKGCNKNLTTKSGKSALDFTNDESIISILRRGEIIREIFEPPRITRVKKNLYK